MGKKVFIGIISVLIISAVLIVVKSFFLSNICTADAIDMCNQEEEKIRKKLSSQCGRFTEDVNDLKKKGWVECSIIPENGTDYTYQLPKTVKGNWLTGKQKWVDCKESELGCDYKY